MAALAAINSFCSISYDYVIAGGGTAGLVLAARLSENPAVNVAILEAGKDRTDDPKVYTPGLLTSMLSDPEYDWSYASTPQVNASGKVINVSRGRQLGGSSGINFMFWTHASQADINNWGELGNEGWSWNNVLPYFLKSETSIPAPAQVANDLEITPQNYDPILHGKDGPIFNSFPGEIDEFQKAWPRTYDNIGLRVDGDPKGGLALGGFSNPRSVDSKNMTRSYAANAYWKPISNRSNVKLLTSALVEKILFEEKRGKRGSLVATGIKFTVDGKAYTVNAKREVILSTGSVGSPQLLERSGIGSKDILKNLNIDVLYDNPNVGENLQDHVISPLGYEVIDGVPTFENFRDPAYLEAALQQYTVNKTGPLAGGACSSALLSYEQCLPADKKGSLPKGIDDLISASEAKKHPGRKEQYVLSKKLLLSHDMASAQEVFLSGGLSPDKGDKAATWVTNDSPGHYFSIGAALEHPFSRGSIHINTSDPTASPVIDLGQLSHPLDLEVMATITLHAQSVARSQPLASLLKENGTVPQPGYPTEVSEETVRGHVRRTLSTLWHLCGTCTMSPRNRGGVVDARLKVYGTGNVRVVDASIFPLQVTGNLASLTYAVAEKAADLIKEDAGKNAHSSSTVV